MFEIERLNYLTIALVYCRQRKGIFTTGERICINQERKKLLALEPMEGETVPVTIPVFDMPKVIENKLQFIITKIKKDDLLVL